MQPAIVAHLKALISEGRAKHATARFKLLAGEHNVLGCYQICLQLRVCVCEVSREGSRRQAMNNLDPA